MILPPNCSTAATGLPSADPLEPPEPTDAAVPGLDDEAATELAGLDGGVLGVPALIAAASATPVT